MKKQSLSLVAAAIFASGTLSAQQGWFVDPVGGSNANSGLSSGDAFKTLGHALLAASAADNVFCLPGTYSAATGESFPIGVKNGVGISSLGGIPVFNGGGTATLFNLGGNVTLETAISGLSLTGAATLFAIQAGRSVDGLRLQECVFSGALGFDAALTTSSLSQDLEVSGCTFSGVAGSTALQLTVSDGALNSGSFSDNQILGDFDAGIALNAGADGVIGAGFLVQRNSIAGCTIGINAGAGGSGGNPLTLATVAAVLIANKIDGAGVASDTGIRLAAAVGTVGEGAQVSCPIGFNEVMDCDVAVLCATDNDLNNRADVISDFYGNVLTGSATGVMLDAALPNPLERNCDPNFGGNPDGAIAGYNSFGGFVTDFDLALTQSAALYARNCWFDNTPVSQDGTLLTPPLYEDPLRATVSGSIVPNTAAEVLTLTAAAASGFVDYGLGGSTGQITVEVDGIAIPQSDIEALVPGTRLAVALPALVSGLHSLDVTNPGGQAGSFDFLVGGGSGGAATGCFVATAAHGDYNAPEVLALRGLRDQYLANSVPGRSFIRWYYREGPAAANWIAVRPWARAATRVALQPAVWTSRALTNWNPGERFAFALLMVGATFALVRRRNP